ncbi:hypothetical protein KP509_15G042400 [Ceratopteris richardii]|uniref:Uncharacterized protein n=1 Tax=Ceratopteris richardii TaxID=49495 RepID=A0A8T2T4Y4_CERRI|nr:hypothetical protein KP509_15G042400 [Ceratopteris richardii]
MLTSLRKCIQCLPIFSADSPPPSPGRVSSTVDTAQEGNVHSLNITCPSPFPISTAPPTADKPCFSDASLVGNGDQKALHASGVAKDELGTGNTLHETSCGAEKEGKRHDKSQDTEQVKAHDVHAHFPFHIHGEHNTSCNNLSLHLQDSSDTPFAEDGLAETSASNDAFDVGGDISALHHVQSSHSHGNLTLQAFHSAPVPEVGDLDIASEDSTFVEEGNLYAHHLSADMADLQETDFFDESDTKPQERKRRRDIMKAHLKGFHQQLKQGGHLLKEEGGKQLQTMKNMKEEGSKHIQGMVHNIYQTHWTLEDQSNSKGD